MLAQTRWKATTLWHLGLHDGHGYESETMVGRYLGRMQWWYPYVGFDYHFKKKVVQKIFLAMKTKIGSGKQAIGVV